MDILYTLDQIQHKALADPALRAKLLAVRDEAEPLFAFCRVCAEAGYEISPMELVCAGEDFHAQMKRSTNGGGENSPMLSGEDDFFELFLAALSL